MQISQVGITDNDQNNVTGVLLAGGKSRRMGQDKAAIKLAGSTMFERTLKLLQNNFKHVLIAGDRPDLARPQIPAFPDIYPGSALGGLYTGLKTATTDWIFVAPCDMPFPDERIVHLLLQYRANFDAVVPRTNQGYEPVFALYHKNCLPQMEKMLQQGQYRIYAFYQRIKIRYLDSSELPDGWQQALLNVNTPDDLARIKEKNMAPPVVSIVAKSGTGKTTLLEKLISELKQRGYRVAAVKHDAHSFSIDHEGKDSWRLTAAGADTMIITSPEKLAMVKRNPADQEPDLKDTLEKYTTDVDIVLTEGFKRNTMPKIEVHRQQRSEQLLCRGLEHDPKLLAVASDSSLDLDVPVYNINDSSGLCDLIVARFLS
ncbi:molybdopterin-guanine dinucleotide biosynthesis protein B [Desulfuromusa kysingii]|uniref:Probable molybdenum cofactor guanylyltransferase n=1 Tax=Desulfuromusa kysingii TaxID=37625 RepID=A0A1H4DQI5_9BACT|nr:bifunctional molybdenum cofactor guanylyltransferase MobA/molybdopterin-guanine dinucleotide biosynthesis adaptor protein MobB [Desulfuromusa kysingii]SEA75014.1 molybdopterin-guanine dinucleotide biosynthesis protein B [Desulfuromusa kysingii]